MSASTNLKLHGFSKPWKGMETCLLPLWNVEGLIQFSRIYTSLSHSCFGSMRIGMILLILQARSPGLQSPEIPLECFICFYDFVWWKAIRFQAPNLVTIMCHRKGAKVSCASKSFRSFIFMLPKLAHNGPKPTNFQPLNRSFAAFWLWRSGLLAQFERCMWHTNPSRWERKAKKRSIGGQDLPFRFQCQIFSMLEESKRYNCCLFTPCFFAFFSWRECDISQL